MCCVNVMYGIFGSSSLFFLYILFYLIIQNITKCTFNMSKSLLPFNLTLRRNNMSCSPWHCTSSRGNTPTRWHWTWTRLALPACCPMPDRIAARSPRRRIDPCRTATAGSCTCCKTLYGERAPWQRLWSPPALRGTLPSEVSSRGAVGIPMMRSGRALILMPAECPWYAILPYSCKLPKKKQFRAVNSDIPLEKKTHPGPRKTQTSNPTSQMQ